MHTRAILDGNVLVRPLANGDVATVAALFERLTDSDLRLLARVDRNRHVLVAYVGAEVAGLARLVRDGDAAEIAFEVADGHQGRGLGTELVALLLADARAAGIARVEAEVEVRNRRACALVRRVLGRPSVRCDGGELQIAAPLV